MNLPPRIHTDEFWTTPPPELSPRCRMWVERIRNGWRGNKRIRIKGYYEASEYFGVYIWEYLEIIYPLLSGRPLSDKAVMLISTPSSSG